MQTQQNVPRYTLTQLGNGSNRDMELLIAQVDCDIEEEGHKRGHKKMLNLTKPETPEFARTVQEHGGGHVRMTRTPENDGE